MKPAAALVLSLTLALISDVPGDREQGRDVEVQQLTPHAWLISGAGANCVVIDGAEGAMLLDCKPPAQNKAVQQALARISNRPLRYLVYTHHHRGNTEAGPTLGQGAVTIAHGRAHQRLLEVGHPGAEVTFDAKLRVNLRPFTISLYHKGPAHTDGDSIVYFHEERVLFLGDLASPGYHPVILPEHGASIREWIRVLRSLERDFRDDDGLTVVPAHGPAGSMEMVRDQITYLEDLISSMEEAHRHGLTLSEARREGAPLREKYSDFKGSGFERNLEAAYRETGG